MTDYIRNYFDEVKEVVDSIRAKDIQRIVEQLIDLRVGGVEFSFSGWEEELPMRLML